MGKRAKIWSITFFLILFIGALLLTFSFHLKKDHFTWGGEIYADKAGYYMYLPASFFYHFDVEKAPQDIDIKTGNGFVINWGNHTFNTKYTCGVAVMLSPFFLLAHGISLVFSLPEQGGFSPLYHAMVNIAAVCYLILGLMLLKMVLAKYFSQLTQYLSILFIFIGTNLLYYTVEDTLMSHVYSFFLFSLFLFSAQKFWKKNRYSYFFLVALSGSMAILVRPTNFLLFTVFFFLDLTGWRDLLRRINLFVTPKYLITFILVLFLVLLPQFIYWKYLHDSYLFYSYGNEGFTNLADPKLFEVWFAPLNGLILYSPIVLVILAGMVIMIWRRNRNGWFFLILFFLLSYECASWQTWYFGCSFGQRSFVEYYAIFVIPFAFLIEEVTRQKGMILKVVVLLFIVAFSYYNIRMTAVYKKCFFGSTWDFTRFQVNLVRADLIPGGYQLHHENINPVIVEPFNEFSASGSWLIEDFKLAKPTRIVVESRVKNPADSILGARIVCSIERDYVPVLYQSATLDSIMVIKKEWHDLKAEFEIPAWILPEYSIKVYYWNRNRSRFRLDTTRVTFFVK
ncbi:hypothetical protein H8E88_01220 [candidate division KSB1 bacterium]|nr:hypothetical protein [candidate division KSB1 bacterium]